MNIAIKNIHCSTANIYVDGVEYTVCYWPITDKRVICWVTNYLGDLYSHGRYQGTEVERLIPLFQAICDYNIAIFESHSL